MTSNIIYYRRRGSAVTFCFCGFVHTYFYYSTRAAYRLFKDQIGVNRARLVKDNSPITYGFLY